MDTAFTTAATTAPTRLVITSDWQNTLIDIGEINYRLFEFLSDAKRAGHRVIITSTLAPHKIGDVLDLVFMSARKKGWDFIPANEFEIISKPDLKNMGLDIDYAFDDEPIGRQPCVYAAPGLEIRVNKDFDTSPLNLAQLRALCGLPQRESRNAANVPAPDITGGPV